VHNFRDEINREQRISHDSLYNLYELSYQLKFKNRKGDSENFIKYIAIHPRILIHLFSSPLLECLHYLVSISSTPVALHYDTVFNMGDYYMSTITFQHHLFNGNPIIPCGFFIHSRRFHDDHKLFMLKLCQVWQRK